MNFIKLPKKWFSQNRTSQTGSYAYDLNIQCPDLYGLLYQIDINIFFCATEELKKEFHLELQSPSILRCFEMYKKVGVALLCVGGGYLS